MNTKLKRADLAFVGDSENIFPGFVDGDSKNWCDFKYAYFTPEEWPKVIHYLSEADPDSGEWIEELKGQAADGHGLHRLKSATAFGSDGFCIHVEEYL